MQPPIIIKMVNCSAFKKSLCPTRKVQLSQPRAVVFLHKCFARQNSSRLPTNCSCYLLHPFCLFGRRLVIRDFFSFFVQRQLLCSVRKLVFRYGYIFPSLFFFSYHLAYFVISVFPFFSLFFHLLLTLY